MQQLPGLVFSLMLSVLCLTTWAHAADARCDSIACIDSLEVLTVDALRRERWNGAIDAISPATPREPAHEPGTGGSGGEGGEGDESGEGGAAHTATGPAAVGYMLHTRSDGLAQFARLDMPAAGRPSTGFPLVIFVHGWIGMEQAPSYDFSRARGGLYHAITDMLLARGFAVLTPGFRGHGTVDGRAAEGIEFLEAWDTGSYLSPMFYARDLMNLLQALANLNPVDAAHPAAVIASRLDTTGIYLMAHSQGGDTALTALAIAGDNPRVPLPIRAASIWSGNIPDRFTQANTFGPMGSTLQAFLAGDGTWTGSARGKDGSINPDFVFAWPPDWIGTLDTGSPDWGWQEQSWPVASVETALRLKYSEMYQSVRTYTRQIEPIEFEITRGADGRLSVVHVPYIAATMPRIGGYQAVSHITQPLHLHFSDRDYYSLPAWNEDLARRINDAGGHARAFEYPGTNHSLRVSKHRWFSPAGTQDGLRLAIERDVALFRSLRPESRTQPRQ